MDKIITLGLKSDHYILWDSLGHKRRNVELNLYLNNFKSNANRTGKVNYKYIWVHDSMIRIINL